MTILFHHLMVIAACAAAATLALPARGAPVLPAGDGYTHSVLASFSKERGPVHPQASLLAHPDGHLYGTSADGGKHQWGTVFRVAPDGAVTVLHHFSWDDGRNPRRAPLLLSSNGFLYGTTDQGGAHDEGTVFRFKPGGQHKVLHEFGPHDLGYVPTGGLIEGADGSLYGVTRLSRVGGRGTVFRMSPHGKVTVLHEFGPTCTLGCDPTGLVDGGDGYLYGTTQVGGSGGVGTIYRMDLAGEVEHLHSFSQAIDGGWPRATLTRDANGDLFGATSNFGPRDFGTVFRFDRDGTVTVLKVLSYKQGNPVPGPLLAASDGALYMATENGGRHGEGAVLRFDKAGGDEIVHSFRPSQGYGMWAGLVQGADGALYGATQRAPHKRGRYGTVYRIDRPVP
jgi:uncharacterized repeat protein (TIGR03803 family)